LQLGFGDFTGERAEGRLLHRPWSRLLRSRPAVRPSRCHAFLRTAERKGRGILSFCRIGSSRGRTRRAHQPIRMGGARLRYRHLIACSPAASHCRRAAFIPGRYAGRCSCTYKRDAGAALAVPVGEGPLPQSSATLCPKRRAPHLHHAALSSAHAWPLDRFKRVPPRHYQATTDAIEIASAGGHSLGITDACHGAHGAKTIGSQPRIGICALKPEAAIARRCQRRYCFADRYRKHRCRCPIGAGIG
jgi:hypothetical protein